MKKNNLFRCSYNDCICFKKGLGVACASSSHVINIYSGILSINIIYKGIHVINIIKSKQKGLSVA